MIRSKETNRRNALARGAAGLFAEHGFHGVTIDAIGAACGVSGPAVYHHFTSKEALLDEMLVSVSEGLLARARTIVRYSSDSTHALDALLRAHIDFALSEPALITIQHRDLVHASDQGRSTVRTLQRAYVELWVDQLVAREPPLPEKTARSAVHAVIGLVNSTPHSARLARGSMSDLLHRMSTAALSCA